jgi:hypothetical protein
VRRGNLGVTHDFAPKLHFAHEVVWVEALESMSFNAFIIALYV